MLVIKGKKFSRISLLTKIDLSEGFDPNREVEILTTAKQYDARYGEFQFKRKDLEEAAKHFNEDVVGTEIAVDHDHGTRSEGVALGWIVPGSMRVGPSTRLPGEFSLYAKLHKFTPKGKDYVKTGALRYFSVEIEFKFEKMINGAKKIFKNVIRGLALTNRPVIKDMAPTFSENPSYISNPTNMKELYMLFGGLKAKDSITKAEFSEFQKLGEEAVEADESNKEEVEEMSSELEDKVDGEGDGDGDGDGSDGGDGGEGDADAKLAELAENAVKKALSEAGNKKTYSEADVKAIVASSVKEASASSMKALNEIIDKTRAADFSAKVDALCLSEDRAIGFKADAKKGLSEFVCSLSDDQAKKYFELHQNIIAKVDLAEHGADVAAKALSEDAYKELNEKAAKYAEANKVSEADALKAVLSEDAELADRIQKLEDDR